MSFKICTFVYHLKNKNIMSKHNNNLMPSASLLCRCGRRGTIAEDKAGIGLFSYTCPDCSHKQHAKPLTSEEYYEQFKR